MMTLIRLQHGFGTSGYRMRSTLGLYSINFCAIGLRRERCLPALSPGKQDAGPLRAGVTAAAPSTSTRAARNAPAARSAAPRYLPRSCALVLLAPSTVMSTAGTTVAFRGGRKRGLGGNLEPGRDFPGPGGFRVSPQSVPNCSLSPLVCAEWSRRDPDLALLSC